MTINADFSWLSSETPPYSSRFSIIAQSVDNAAVSATYYVNINYSEQSSSESTTSTSLETTTYEDEETFEFSSYYEPNFYFDGSNTTYTLNCHESWTLKIPDILQIEDSN